MKKSAAQTPVEQLDDVIAMWEKNTDFTLGPDLSLKTIKDTRKALADSVNEVKSLNRQLIEQTDLRDDLSKTANEYVVRARKGVLGFFGADSTQYSQVGGTRSSERKRPGRKAKTIDDKKAA